VNFFLSHETLIQDQCDILIDIIHHGEGSDTPLLNTQFLHHECFIRQSQIHLSLQLQHLAQLLGVDSCIRRDTYEKQSVLLVLQKQVFSVCFGRAGEGDVGNEFVGCHGEGVRVGVVGDGGGRQFLEDGVAGEIDVGD